MHERTRPDATHRAACPEERRPAAWTEPEAHAAAVAALRAGDHAPALRWLATVMPRWADRLRRDHRALTDALEPQRMKEDVR